MKLNLSAQIITPGSVPSWRVPGRIVYIAGTAADTSLNQQVHAVAKGLTSHGYSVLVVQLIMGSESASIEDAVSTDHADGVRYLHLPSVDVSTLENASSTDTASTTQAISNLLRLFKPSLVVIALNQITSQPAKQAAQQLDLPIAFESAHDSQGTSNAPALPSHVQKQVTYTRQDQADFQAILQALQSLPDHQIKPHKSVFKAARMRVAAVMDEFTYHSYAPECELLQLTPANALAELDEFRPQLLFIESAWRGKDDLWDRKIGTLSTELKEVIAWCKNRLVPTMFWNKEDPIHFETFLTTAQQFDFVFTTDIDCISRYKAALGHERVYLLPFAAQPKTHNPIDLYDRKDAFCFAGAYYVRYPDRTRDLENYVEALPKFRPLEIFDRNFGKDDPNYQFPPEYQPYIVGTLAFHEIDKAYKGYRYAINLNSIKQSQTMFARRVYELLASNTVTVSNFSRGVRLMFGDLVVTTDSGSEMVQRLQRLSGDTENSDKLRLAALRKVMLEHTYAHRMAYVTSKVLKRPMVDALPSMLVVAYASNAAEHAALLRYFEHQTHNKRRMVLISEHNAALAQASEAQADHRITLLDSSQANTTRLESLVQEGDWVVPMLAQDYYGPNYLLDLAIATNYSQTKLVGKVAHYQSTPEGINLVQPEAAYRPTTTLLARASALKGTALPWLGPLITWITQLTTMEWQHQSALATDYFNYCRDGTAAPHSAALQLRVDDRPLNTGIPIDQLLTIAEKIGPMEKESDSRLQLKCDQMASLFGTIEQESIGFKSGENRWEITSELPDKIHKYIYARTEIPLTELPENELKTYLDASPGLNIQLVLVFLDEKKQKISHVIQSPNRNYTTPVPIAAIFIRLGIRVYGSGQAHINALEWSHRKLEPAALLGNNKHLVLTNNYPSYNDLYRNGFVHSRVKAYQDQGVNVDVFRMRDGDQVSYHEFENIDIITGSQSALEKLLGSGRYESVLVHFLDEIMWQVLENHIIKVKIVVWIHGAEIQHWHRRKFNYTTDLQREKASNQSELRMKFWRALLKNIPENLSFVFVSKYLAESVMEDIGFQLPISRYSIIHNGINTNLFQYIKKDSEQRKKILSIRPYASKIYANDLSVKAIIELTNKPYFNDLEILIIGDGILFDETLEPLRKFDNIQIEKKFLTHEEISKLHREFGLFLCPSRMDTQGVSRDEAMASGLVPITNAVTAIPEFVDETSGILAPGDDAIAMAEGIERLYSDPVLFASMSAAAAQRVRRQCAQEVLVKLELQLIQ